MSTTTSATRFSSVSTSGSNRMAWTSTSNLTSGSSAATASSTFRGELGTREVRLSSPAFGVSNGAEFVSLKVTFSDKYDGITGSGFTSYAYLTGGTLKTLGPVAFGSYTSRSLEGDSSYWGISGTVQQIVRDIQDGTIAFNYYADFTGAHDYVMTVYLKDVQATLTYKDPDTKRASIIVTLP